MADTPNKTTHAQRRRAEAQEASRLKLKAGQFVRRLREIADRAEECEASKVPALRLKAEIYWRLLAKCLPDMKAVEHSGKIDHQHEFAAAFARAMGASTQPEGDAGVGTTQH